MIVVSNASPVINLAAIDRLDLLRSLFGEIVIPRAVFDEVAVAGEGDPGSIEVRTFEWIRTAEVANRTLVMSLSLEMDDGEAEAVALACEMRADLVLLDEKIAREAAFRIGLKCAGVIGMLVEAKRRALIPSVKPLLDELVVKAGFRVSPSLYERVLQTAGERR